MESQPEPITPRPILGDSVRETARERERSATKKPFLPNLFGKPHRSLPPAEPPAHNPWRVIIETIPVDATVVRPVLPIRAVRGAVVAGRSRFRKGTMTLDADGFTLAGTGVTSVDWLGKIGCLGYMIGGVVVCIAMWTPWDAWLIPPLYGIGGIGFLVGVVGTALESAITETRRGPQEIRVFWNNVLEAQFEERMRWAVILYRAPEPMPGVPGPIAHLPINNLTPAVAAALWDAFDAYAPGRTRPDSGVYRWTTGRKVAALIILSPLLAGIIMLIRLIL